MAITLVERVSLASATTSITFSDIPAGGKDILLVIAAEATSTNLARLIVNGDTTTANYASRALFLTAGSPTTPQSGSETNVTIPTTSTLQAGTIYGNTSVLITNYSKTATKSISIEGAGIQNGAGGNALYLVGTTYLGTDKVTSVTIEGVFAPGLETGSTADLYIVS